LEWGGYVFIRGDPQRHFRWRVGKPCCSIGVEFGQQVEAASESNGQAKYQLAIGRLAIGQ
jgi:hypothetical protein